MSSLESAGSPGSSVMRAFFRPAVSVRQLGRLVRTVTTPDETWYLPDVQESRRHLSRSQRSQQLIMHWLRCGIEMQTSEAMRRIAQDVWHRVVQATYRGARLRLCVLRISDVVGAAGVS